MYGNGTLLKLYRGISVIVIAAGVIGIFVMNGTLIRLDERMIHVVSRLDKIELHHEMSFSGGRSGAAER